MRTNLESGHPFAEVCITLLKYNCLNACLDRDRACLFVSFVEEKYTILETRSPYPQPPPPQLESSFKHYIDGAENGPEIINMTGAGATVILPPDQVKWGMVAHRYVNGLLFSMSTKDLSYLLVGETS